MAKQNANITTLGQIQSDKESAYLSAPLISAPNSTITDLSGNTRQMRDPSKTLRPAIGIERVMVNSIKLIVNEKGPNGEPVYGVDDGDDRIRIVGNPSANSDTNGTRALRLVTQPTDGYIEVTFYGTRLNVLALSDGGARTFQAAVDGGSLTTYQSTTISNVLATRNYKQNIVLTAIPTQSLGVHTVKLQNSSGSLELYGVEILNESSSIRIPQGEIISKGKKSVIGAATTTGYNSGFDGSPVLNGRGGRVVIYEKDGYVGKVIQQTNASTQIYPAADHASEEIIRKINFREFGANRSDDLSTLSSNSTRAFTLEDGSVALFGAGVAVQTASVLGEGLALSGAASYMTICFIGTGLDVVVRSNNTEVPMTGVHSIIVDGVTLATGVTGIPNRSQIQKVVSGLPYGSHTVKFLVTSTNFNYIISDFLIYGPKKPAIPTGATEIGEYYLMANYSASAVTGTGILNNNEMPLGVITKAPTRELLYEGTWAVNVLGDFNFPHGFNVQSTTANSYSYTFWGTGIHMHLFCSSSGVYTVSATIDGVANATGTNLVNMSNGGGGSYSTTSTTNGAPARFAITGLTLGLHTIRLTRTAGATWGAVAQNVICPVHYPDTKRGSLAIKPSDTFAERTELGGVDLSKAKAWLAYDMLDSVILSSYNIAGALTTATGRFTVWFERPFKNANWVPVGMGESTGESINIAINQAVQIKTAQGCGFAVDNEAGTDVSRVVYFAIFGELENE